MAGREITITTNSTSRRLIMDSLWMRQMRAEKDGRNSEARRCRELRADLAQQISNQLDRRR